MLSYDLKLKFGSLYSDSSSAGPSSSSLSSADLFLLEMSGTSSNVEFSDGKITVIYELG